MPRPFFNSTPREAFERTAVMAGKRLYLICVFILTLLVVAGARAQAPSIPSDVKAIEDKLRTGQPLTDAEEKRMDEWGDSINAAPAAGAGKNPFASAAQTAKSTSQSSTPCPPAHASLVTAAAPTRAEYVVLVKSLVETYGKKLGTHRAEFDHIFAKPGAASTASQAGPVLFISGAAGASVYASAVAAVANPDDLQVASNLGVALDSIPDAKAASAVLLYAHKLAPQQAMPALNLAWVYFNSGHAAEAKALFQNAANLDPDLSGPSAGLGMLASCQGDTATAMTMFRKSLSKSYSGVVAVGYTQAQQAQEQQQQQNSTEPPPSLPPSGSADSSPLPELPASADPQATLGSAPAFQQAMTYTNSEMQAAMKRVQDAQARVLAIGRRAQIDPDGTIDLPRVFDKQLFEYRQIAMLTIGASQSGLNQTMQQAIGVIEPTNQQTMKQILADQPNYVAVSNQLRDEEEDALKKLREALSGEAVAPDDKPSVPTIPQGTAEKEYKDCKLVKGMLETDYAQHFKIWKQFSDTARASSRDLYAYSQPIIDQIWVPSLNELVQANRELAVLALYKEDAGYATALAGLAKGLNELKCVEPQPPGSPKTIKDPTLTKKEPDCPLNPPLNLNFGVAKMELGCDHVKFSGGEILQVEVERKFGKSTAYSVGLGVSASMPSISLGDGGSLGDNGKSWSPPGSSVTANVGAQIMVTVRVDDNGAVGDVFVKSTVQASGSAGPLSGAIGITGTISLEDGAASVTPILKGSAGSK
jgi:tetratricopeptide (TPR) repeat protein